MKLGTSKRLPSDDHMTQSVTSSSSKKIINFERRLQYSIKSRNHILYSTCTMFFYNILLIYIISPTEVWSLSAPRSIGRRTYSKYNHRNRQVDTFVFATKLALSNGKINSEQGQQKLDLVSVNDDRNVIATAGALEGVTDDGYEDLGRYDPSENLPQSERAVPNVGDPQLRVKEKEQNVMDILKELAAIQQQGPQKYLILGTRHCSFLHQQIIELLAYALVLSGNHVYTSGAGGTHAATIRGALRAEREDLLTVVLPQSMSKQTKESQELLQKVDDLITMPKNDDMSLDVASRICNSYLLSLTDQLISFAFHESNTVIEASKEAKALDMLVTTLYLD